MSRSFFPRITQKLKGQGEGKVSMSGKDEREEGGVIVNGCSTKELTPLSLYPYWGSNKEGGKERRKCGSRARGGRDRQTWRFERAKRPRFARPGEETRTGETTRTVIPARERKGAQSYGV